MAVKCGRCRKYHADREGVRRCYGLLRKSEFPSAKRDNPPMAPRSKESPASEDQAEADLRQRRTPRKKRNSLGIPRAKRKSSDPRPPAVKNLPEPNVKPQPPRQTTESPRVGRRNRYGESPRPTGRPAPRDL